MSLREVLAGTAGTLVVRVASVGLNLGCVFLLAAHLGPAEYGVYAYALTIVAGLIVVATFGVDRLLVREVVAAEMAALASRQKGLLLWSLGLGALLSAALAAIVLAVLFATGFSSNLAPVLAIALVLVPLTAWDRARTACTQALGRVVTAQLPELLVQPLVLLGAIGLVLGSGTSLDASLAMVLKAGAVSVGAAAGALLLWRTLGDRFRGLRARARFWRWTRASVPFLAATLLFFANSRADILMLGAFRGDADVGVYGVAARAAELLSYFLVAANVALAPRVARHHRAGELRELERVARSMGLLTLAAGLPAVLLLGLAGGELLAVLGHDFGRGHGALAILCGAQLTNLLFGPVGVVLNMTGGERDVTVGMALSVSVNVAANLLLIPPFGLEGAAAATALGTIAWNAYLSTRVAARYAIRVGLVGARRRPLGGFG